MIAPLTILVLNNTNLPLMAKEQKVRMAIEKDEWDDGVTDETRRQLFAWKDLNALRSLFPLAGAVFAGVALYLQ